MADYRLSRMAELQLVEIIAYSEQHFGERQADAYLAGFVATFKLLADFPGIGPAAYEMKAGWRRYRYQSHYVFYTDRGNHVLIEAILHIKRNIRSDLFE